MNITLEHAGETLHVHSFADRCRDGSAVTIACAGDLGARGFLLRHFGGALGMMRLRAALGAEASGVDRLSDDDVIAACAARLAGGAWRVCRHVRRPAQASAARGAAANAAAAAPAPAPSPAPRPAPAPARAPSAAPAPAAAAPAAAAEWPASSNQVAQAQALVRAAQTGAPFCELCERGAAAAA